MKEQTKTIPEAKPYKFRKFEERFCTFLNRPEESLRLEVYGDCEILNERVPRYRIECMELQMWQTKAELVAWIRFCADAIEKNLP